MFLKDSASQETLALLKLADSGLKFGSVSSDPNDLTYVAPGALSNISQAEYDYSDYYDDLEETSKKRRDVGVTVEFFFYCIYIMKLITSNSSFLD